MLTRSTVAFEDEKNQCVNQQGDGWQLRKEDKNHQNENGPADRSIDIKRPIKIFLKHEV